MSPLEQTRRRISEIEDSLAHPAEEGRDWARRRAALERELEQLKRKLVARAGGAA
jgi:hypothetical protein